MSLLSEPARPHDLEPALALLRDADLPTEGVVEQFGHFFVVRDAGLLVGLCGLEVHGEHGLLRSLVVAPTYRGEGLAGLLVDAALRLARKMGLRAVYLLTTTARATSTASASPPAPATTRPPPSGSPGSSGPAAP